MAGACSIHRGYVDNCPICASVAIKFIKQGEPRQSTFLLHVDQWLEVFGWRKLGDRWVDGSGSEYNTAMAIAIQVSRSEQEANKRTGDR